MAVHCSAESLDFQAWPCTLRFTRVCRYSQMLGELERLAPPPSNLLFRKLERKATCTPNSRRQQAENMDMEDLRGDFGYRASESKYFCEEAKQLLAEFAEAVRDLVMLHEQQYLAVVEGDIGAHRFDLLIHDASEKKQNAKYAYLSHLEKHGCS